MKNTSGIFNYRLCKSSWGIAIDIDAEQTLKTNLSNKDQKICDNLYIQSNLHWLSESERKYLSKGLQLSSSSVDKTLNNDKVILVKELIFNFTDYQEEGPG